jgi:hypothetical protein
MLEEEVVLLVMVMVQEVQDNQVEEMVLVQHLQVQVVVELKVETEQLTQVVAEVQQEQVRVLLEVQGAKESLY